MKTICKCGSNSFYVTEKHTGTGAVFYNEGEVEADYSAMYDDVASKAMKTAHCTECYSSVGSAEKAIAKWEMMKNE